MSPQAQAEDPYVASSALWTGAEGVEIVGDLAYLSYPNGLAIFDISDPAAPRLLSRLDRPGQGHELEVSGEYVYLAKGFDGLRIIDVSNPRARDHERSRFSGSG